MVESTFIVTCAPSCCSIFYASPQCLTGAVGVREAQKLIDVVHELVECLVHVIQSNESLRLRAHAPGFVHFLDDSLEVWQQQGSSRRSSTAGARSLYADMRLYDLEVVNAEIVDILVGLVATLVFRLVVSRRGRARGTCVRSLYIALRLYGHELVTVDILVFRLVAS